MKSAHAPTAAGKSAELAAEAIVELINSRPRSPRPEEIVAIINALVGPPVSAAPCPHCADLDREYGPILHRT
jgi:hypothetical protein